MTAGSKWTICQSGVRYLAHRSVNVAICTYWRGFRRRTWRFDLQSGRHHSSVVARSLSELVLGRIAVHPNNRVIELPRGRWLSSELLTQTKVHLLEQRRRDAVIPRCGNCRIGGLRPTVSALGTLVCSVLHRCVPVHVDAELLADSGPAQALISIDLRAYRRCQTQRSHNTPHR